MRRRLKGEGRLPRPGLLCHRKSSVPGHAISTLSSSPQIGQAPDGDILQSHVASAQTEPTSSSHKRLKEEGEGRGGGPPPQGREETIKEWGEGRGDVVGVGRKECQPRRFWQSS